MKNSFDLSKLNWQLFGFNPYEWSFSKAHEMGFENCAEISLKSVPVPGSVQTALQQAKLLPDWNLGLNARQCEWVENRHWIYETHLPDDWFGSHQTYWLHCLGLDYSGWIWVNGVEITAFQNSFLPKRIDLTPFLKKSGNVLQIIFNCPPRWLGQFGRTSQMKEWKPRFNYYWDWTSRLVQIGIWDGIFLEAVDAGEIQNLTTKTAVDFRHKKGRLEATALVTGAADFRIHARLSFKNQVLHEEELPLIEFQQRGMRMENLPVELWWPNGFGAQPLYLFEIQLLTAAGKPVDSQSRRLGFRDIAWQPCAGSVPESDPWICVVNGQPVFLQGVNWTPIRPNFADLTPEDYRKRVELYQDLGCTIFRVWGGAFLEKTWFYDLCDELGILVWQEFPLSSSGVDNFPPDDLQTIEELSLVAISYIQRRHQHPSLIIWSGGNELSQGLEQNTPAYDIPVDTSHPLIRRFAEITHALDPARRFLPTSPSGPVFSARDENYGKGMHWDVHGPWNAVGPLHEKWQKHWECDDSLIRSEVGAPGPSPLEIIEKYQGEYAAFPASFANPLWRRTSWWIEWPEFLAEHQREPKDLAEYVRWGQQRQAEALSFAANVSKNRFPHCGGFIVWMGHDSFPCMANTAIIDFEGNPKPAALALKKIFRRS